MILPRVAAHTLHKSDLNDGHPMLNHEGGSSALELREAEASGLGVPRLRKRRHRTCYGTKDSLILLLAQFV